MAASVKHLTTEEFAERMGISVRTAEDWRTDGYGPPYLPGRGGNRGSGGVRYRLSDIEAWEKSRLKAPSTA
jgi:predicted DNA-binding transcriptional regulator AlpA